MFQIIETTAQYEEALATIYQLLQKGVKKDSEEAQKLLQLSILVEMYEQKKYLFPNSPNP
ncbi:MAG: hypothetical protein ACOVQA_09410 [Thermoflexibacteraceae bacterium]|jgi:antitoxin component HigA of HigAB toxin-antitoxin module